MSYEGRVPTPSRLPDMDVVFPPPWWFWVPLAIILLVIVGGFVVGGHQ